MPTLISSYFFSDEINCNFLDMLTFNNVPRHEDNSQILCSLFECKCIFIFLSFCTLFAYRLFDWRPERMRGEPLKCERVVIIKNLFAPEDFDNEVQLLLEYQQDIRSECLKCGDVRKVIIYDVSFLSFFTCCYF